MQSRSPHRREPDAADAASLARRARRRRRPVKHRSRRLAIAAVLLGLLAVGAVAATAVTGASLIQNDCSLDALRPVALGENSFVYARDGSLLGVIPSQTNRQPLGLRQMSRWLPRATVAIEDRRFYEHGGLDYQGIARAAVTNLEHGKILQGGSTITQQLVRNLYIAGDQRTFSRKLKEACLALKLGDRWSHDRILATYLNEVAYGNHAFGVEAAAQTYFSRSARTLTLPQAALIAGLPQAPTLYDPFRRPDRALERRNEVIRAMRVAGSIDERQFEWALVAPLGLRRGGLYTAIQHPNFFGYAERELVSRFGARRVQNGGLHVETTLDQRLQRLAARVVASTLKERTDPAAALVAIDPASGAIRAMVSYAPGHRRLDFNLASQGHRQAGSSFKPFVLATAMQQGDSLYSSIYGASKMTIDDPRCATNGQPWEVSNYADEESGTFDLISATANSVNTIFAQLVVKVGPDKVVDLAHRLGIRSHLQPVCSITLGSQSVTPLEMTNAYATFAARGVHRPAQSLALVRGPGGGELGRLDPHGTRALGQNESDLVTYALQQVVQRGTGTGAAIGRPVAGKTGTAENFQDAWFCGYTPQLATCVWIGYPKAEIPLHNVEGYADVFGGSLPASIWHDFMAGATWRWPVRDFTTPTIGGTLVTGTGASQPVTYSPPVATVTPPPPVTAPAPAPTGPPPLQLAPPAPTAPPKPTPSVAPADSGWSTVSP